jgi:hypothetical protein
MPRAILQKGAIVPLEPLPADWEEGATLEVQRATTKPFDIGAWADSMNQMCADSLAEDEEAMRLAFNEHRQHAKEQIRRAMGLK